MLEGVGKNYKECAKESGKHQVSILTPEDTSGMVGTSAPHNVRSRSLRRWRLADGGEVIITDNDKHEMDRFTMRESGEGYVFDDDRI